MGGFLLKARQQRDGESVPAPIFLNCESLKFALTGWEIPGESRTGTMGDSSNIPSIPGNILVGKIPNISKDHIQDKSKGDTFVKVKAIVQVGWMIIQTIVRGPRHLAVSQSEIAVLAYSACTIITYYLCIDKPQSVQVPTYILLNQEFGGKKLSKRHQEAIRDCRPRSWFTTSLRLFRYQSSSKEGINVLDPMPNDARYDDVNSLIFTEKSLLTHMDDGFMIAGLIFGSLHCAAWNFTFPTHTEQLLWRICSIITAGTLPLYYGVLLLDIHLAWSRIQRLPLALVEIILALGYLLARIFHMVEVFRSLFFLPPPAFITTWSAQVPHVT